MRIEGHKDKRIEDRKEEEVRMEKRTRRQRRGRGSKERVKATRGVA